MSEDKIELTDKAVNLLLFMKDREIRFEEDEIVVWISFCDIKEFCELFNSSMFIDEGGIDVKLQQECIALDLKEIIEYHFSYEESEYITKKLKEME